MSGYRGYFREKKESRMFHMRHKGTLMVEEAEIVFLGRGDNIMVKYSELKSIELMKKRIGILFNMNNNIVYIYTSSGDAGTSANARSVGNSLFGIQGGNAMSSIATAMATKRINEEIYKMINYHQSKIKNNNN